MTHPIPKEVEFPSSFNVPVVLFTFKRLDTVLRIIEVMRRVRPAKLYLFSDGGRDSQEKEMVANVRQTLLSAIDWDCLVIKCFSEENQGVFKEIGLGALQVFKTEKRAIFLEDDNLPSLSFFGYCSYLLEKYEDNPKVLWVCGTNYLGKYQPVDGSSYLFTRHLLPCGWASWSSKFSKYYDTTLSFVDLPHAKKNFARKYENRALFYQQWNSIFDERNRFKKTGRFSSWDFHMCATIRKNDLLGISPAVNLIDNIGVDSFSAHGGTSFDNVMTRRFCGVPNYELSFPLVDPKNVGIDVKYERKIAKIIAYPFWLRTQNHGVRLIKKILRLGPDQSLKKALFH